jgi:hypothetical protein
MQRICQRRPMPPMDVADRRHVRNYNRTNMGMGFCLMLIAGFGVYFA